MGDAPDSGERIVTVNVEGKVDIENSAAISMIKLRAGVV